MKALENSGWGPDLQSAFENLGRADIRPARVTAAHRGQWDLMTETGPLKATVAGRLNYVEEDPLGVPTVGDFVAYTPGSGLGRIEAVLPRRTTLVRGAVGGRSVPQLIAANVDCVFVLMALDADFNLRRLERYLSQIESAGARATVVLTKADACLSATPFVVELTAAVPEVDCLTVSAISGLGMDGLATRLIPGETVALVGSSGAGKSTLTNALLGTAAQRVHETRADDDKGRHTTTHRELFALPGGTMVIDTPGMRELGLWGDEDEGLNGAFADIEALGSTCRFRDCRHGGEPGCAIAAALTEGTLTGVRLRSYQKLQSELAWSARRAVAGAERAYSRAWNKKCRKATKARKRIRDGG